jgi:hypothetical protein
MSRANRYRLPPVVVAIALGALLFAGCGGPLGKSEYQSRVDRIDRKAQRQLRGVVDGNSPPSARQMRTAGKVFGDAAHDLDGIEPPKGVARAHHHLEQGYQLLGTAFARHADDLAKAKTDADRAQVFVAFADDKDVRKAFSDLTAAQHEFRAAGYGKVLGPDDGGATARSGAAQASTQAPRSATTTTATTTTAK